MTDALIPTTLYGETRIRDLDLAKRLRFDRPRKIKELIERHMAALLKMGVCPTVGRTSGPQGGRPTEDFYLNRKQAIFITAKSETAEATEITIEIIEKFDAYERGLTHAKVAELATAKVELERRRLELAHRRLQVQEINAARQTYQAFSKAGVKAQIANAPEIFAKVGMKIDLSMSSVLDQHELGLPEPEEKAPAVPDTGSEPEDE